MALEFWEDSDHSPLEALLESIKSLRTDESLLEMKTNAGEGLVEGDEAYTWIQLSIKKPGMIALCTEEDDSERASRGEWFEVDTFDMKLEGIDSALLEHFSRQNQYSWTDYEALIKERKFKRMALREVADKATKSLDPHAAVLTGDPANSAVTPEDEPLDASYISNYGIEDFNTALLSDPLFIKENKFLSELEQKDQTMPMLCPVAKALYYLERPEMKDYLGAGLGNVIITDPSRDAQPSREEVVHVVTKSLGGKKILLEFRSSAEFIWAGDDSGCDDWSENGLQVGSLKDWETDSKTSSIKEELLAWLKQIANESVDIPLGDPVDEGPFICRLTYRLSAINGIPVKSQAEILSSTHDLQLVNCNHTKICDTPCSADTNFNWTILLGNGELRNLFEREEWLNEQARTGIDRLEIGSIFNINVDEIHESYKAGKVIRDSAKHIYILIGSGSEWEPGFESAIEDDDEDGVNSRYGDMCYPATHPPLFAYEIILDAKDKEEGEFNECLGIIGPLIQAAAGNA